ncbi:hypothetical protein [Tolypothrix sp. VBCCA 56010]|uniref:hypothetical protein n=1 Tax=Tolypothrix sp. VBCCA 56010 TaxID=3137731 RepID=UPI003D7F12DB
MTTHTEHVDRLAARIVAEAPTIARLLLSILGDLGPAGDAAQPVLAAAPRTALERARERDRLKKARKRARERGGEGDAKGGQRGTDGGQGTLNLSPLVPHREGDNVGDKRGTDGGRAPLSDSPLSSSNNCKTMETLPEEEESVPLCASPPVPLSPSVPHSAARPPLSPMSPSASPTTTPSHDAESEAFETNPANNPEEIIRAWVGEDLSFSDNYRLTNAVKAMRGQPPVKIHTRLVSRLELFVRALMSMRDDGKPYDTMVRTLSYCASVVARCERDRLMPNEWPQSPKGPKGAAATAARRSRREQDTDWGTEAAGQKARAAC